ncbi:hypothetical protein [Alysiella crassa]|uniref:Uncharacterized protein n=1 Tax=Alysiella crassa TaxID=153491 RepID=A0A376BUS0_9NEIS|nr:hypothetical protein [Alysiella crassa]SSY80669.1 Uncharacterised protein [Alysiella crassa]
MNFLDWYLNLTFWQAVLVWLKLLLPVLFMLTVCGLVGFSVKLFSGSLKLPKLAANIQPKRGKQPVEKQAAQ